MGNYQLMMSGTSTNFEITPFPSLVILFFSLLASDGKILWGLEILKMKKSSFIRKPKSVRIATPADDEDDKPKRVTIKEDVVKGSGEGKQGAAGVGRNLSGCRVSVLTGKPMVSTGHAFIDNAFGGGITIGHLGLIEEDVNTTYYSVLFSLFIAQSLSLPLPQHCLLISPFPDQFSTLPKPMNYSESANSSLPKEQLKIAWRYDNILEKSNPSGGFIFRFF